MPKKAKETSTNNTNAAEAPATPIAEAPAKRKPGRPAGSKNRTSSHAKMTNAKLSYLVEKYGEDTIIPVSTAWILEKAQELVLNEVEAIAASATPAQDSEESENEVDVQEREV